MKTLKKQDPLYTLLMRQAHELKPIVTITSDKGLSERHHEEIRAQFKAHELLKIKISTADREQKQSMAAEIAEHHDATLVNAIGHIAIMYKPHEKKSKKN